MIDSADPQRTPRRRLWLVVAASLLGLGALALSTGAVNIAVSDALQVVVSRIGIGTTPEPTTDAVVWGLRVPRLLLAIVVGAMLAAAGATMQGSLRNPLADPHLLAIGPGAAIGAAIGSSMSGSLGAVAGGVTAGLVSGLAVERVARRQSSDPTRLILVGVALGMALSAWVGFVVFAADRATVPPIEFWLLGSLSSATWRVMGWTAVAVVVAAAVLVGLASRIDVLQLGEVEARSLGVDVDRTRVVLFAAVGVGVGATVGAVGVVAFVGLVVPPLVVSRTGAMQRHAVPAAMAVGACVLVAADWLARTLIAPVELPVGLVTAAIGGPFLLWQLGQRHG